MQIGYASVVISVLQILPALMVMATIDRVLEYNSMSTFTLLTTLMAVMMTFEMVLGWARRELVLVLSARMDVRLNLHVFGRLLALPLDFFERSQAGETISRLREVFRVREFLTGKLLYTFLDGITLIVMLPFLFYMEPTLAWVACAVAGLIALINHHLPASGRLLDRHGHRSGAQEGRSHVGGPSTASALSSRSPWSRSRRSCGMSAWQMRGAGAWPPGAWATGRRR